MRSKFDMEKARVARLIERLGIRVERYEDPNATAAGETGADVLAIINGRRVGIQVTDVDIGETPGTMRAAEKRLERDAESRSTTYPIWFDPKNALVAPIVRSTSRKTKLWGSRFNEFWLLICAGIPEFGSIASTLIMTPFLDPSDLDAATISLLRGSPYTNVFLYVMLGLEKEALYSWQRGGSWEKSTQEQSPAEQGPSFWDVIKDPEWLSDPEGKCARGVERYFAERAKKSQDV